MRLAAFFSKLAETARRISARPSNVQLRNQVPTELQKAELKFALARRELCNAERAGDTRRIGAAYIGVRKARTEWLALACDHDRRLELRA